MEFSFTIHEPSHRTNVGRKVANLLLADGEAFVFIAGSELSDDDSAAFEAKVASDVGSPVIRDGNAKVAALRANVAYWVNKRSAGADKASFAKLTANTPDAPVIAYRVALKRK